MPKSSPIQTSFSAGEFAPELAGRVEIGKYESACSRMENFIPLVQGPARRRGGTRFVNEVKASANRTWLARFEFNTQQAYVLEFGNLYVRFYTDDGILESSPGVPVEVVTPWSSSDMLNDDGSFALQMVQSGDILYICHPNYAPRKLARTGATSWSISTFTPNGGPFDDYDPDQTITVSPAAQAGTGISVTASSAVFSSTDVGRLLYIEQPKANSIAQWEPAKAVTAGAWRRSDGKNYLSLSTATTGAVRPTHPVGDVYDGDTGVQWRFSDPGYGCAVIASFVSATEVTVNIAADFPVLPVTVPTTRWAFGSWGSVPGYPSHVTFFRNRLVFARARDRKLWFSVAADYENFSDRDDGGVVTADMSVSLSVESDVSNQIQYLISGDSLIIGTAGGEHICIEQTDSEPFGPTNSKIIKTSDYGARAVQPVRVGDSFLFVQRSGRKLRELSADIVSGDYKSFDMSVLAPHMVPKGRTVVQMAYQKEPHSIVWAARSDGLLLGFTFNREQYADPPFGGWHRHVVGGSAIVESVVCVPSTDNTRDDLWMIVRRTINGATKRYVEFMQAEYESGDQLADAFYVDCGLTYDGSPATTISGLGHLEGQVVDVLADGASHPQRTVASGSITLQRSASVVQVGLPCPAKIATMRVNAGAADGTAQGKTKRINRLVVRLMDTLGGKIGPAETNVDEILFRSSVDLMGSPPAVFTGDKESPFNSGYEKDGIIWYINDQPLPATIVAFMPQLTTQDR